MSAALPIIQSIRTLHTAKRLVIKLGSQIVVDNNGELAYERLSHLIDQCAELRHSGKELILVSSGAVGLGRQQLGLSGTLTLSEKQACAAIGQSLLMNAYRALLEPSGLIPAQVLLTALDFSDRKHYLNLHQTLETILRLGAIPIINENDVTSTMELREEGYQGFSKGFYTKGFGDNDKLSALVAGKLPADLLVILTNVAGIYTDNPGVNPDAQKIDIIHSFRELQQIATAGQSTLGRGGMTSKLEAARIAAISGLPTYIASGLQEDVLAPLLNKIEAKPSNTGTLVLPQASLPGRKRWIGTASGYYGILTINTGAAKALVHQGASLLPVGITAISGEFASQQVVSIQDELGREIGRGLSFFSADDLRKIQGARTEKLQALLGYEHSRIEAIHRDDLVIFDDMFTDAGDTSESIPP